MIGKKYGENKDKGGLKENNKVPSRDLSIEWDAVAVPASQLNFIGKTGIFFKGMLWPSRMVRCCSSEYIHVVNGRKKNMRSEKSKWKLNAILLTEERGGRCGRE